MKLRLLCPSLAAFALGLTLSASARDVVLPAGTLLQCILNEPNFSSATAALGDPVLCHLKGLTEFGQQAFPRGTYMVGHLESAKEPGHLVGKGYLKLQFDRIGLPNGDLPLDAKLIATRKYKVDREGKIRGTGHAKRDVAEWMLPPLWPWKVMMLGARGPRPTLKGESILTLRLMDDVALPQVADGAAPFGTGYFFSEPKNDTLGAAQVGGGSARHAAEVAPAFDKKYTILQTSYPSLATQDMTSAANPYAIRADALKAVLTSAAPGMPVFVLKSGAVLPVSSYTYEDHGVTYSLVGGEGGVISTADIDWSTTIRLNRQRGVRVTLRSGRAFQGVGAM